MKKKIDPIQKALGKIEGLVFSDCVRFFDDRATERDKKICALADDCDHIDNDGGTEIDNCITSEGEDNGAYVMTWTWISFEGVEGMDKDNTCPECGAVEGTPEWGTVGDGFDGYCPSCADKREESGEVEIG